MTSFSQSGELAVFQMHGLAKESAAAPGAQSDRTRIRAMRFLQDQERVAAHPVPAVGMVPIRFGVVDQQMDAIGAGASHQSEQLTATALAIGQPTMCEKFERTVISLYHDQRFADLATVLQLKVIM